MGHVVAIDKSGDGPDTPTIAFNDEAGREWRFDSNLPCNSRTNAIGSGVPVIYDPRNPKRAREHGRVVSKALAALIWYGVTAFFVAFCDIAARQELASSSAAVNRHGLVTAVDMPGSSPARKRRTANPLKAPTLRPPACQGSCASHNHGSSLRVGDLQDTLRPTATMRGPAALRPNRQRTVVERAVRRRPPRRSRFPRQPAASRGLSKAQFQGPRSLLRRCRRGLTGHIVGRLEPPSLRRAEPSPPQGVQSTTTLAPTWTRLYRSITSALVRRMQPDDTAVPIDQGSFEP
jgi:hypothetical protein